MTRQALIDAYQHACEIELQAFKPGNVSIYSEGHDMTVEDFRISYRVSAEPITNPEYSLGEKIYYAVKATREAVGCNTNLGIILLCAPLLQAMMLKKPAQGLRHALSDVLQTTTLQDADWVFKAIALASPGGLGDAPQEDVHQQPSMTLTEAMGLAAERDRIALQYISDYKDVFDFTILAYNRAFNLFDDSAWAAVAVFTAMLGEFPDSHIERKYGRQHTKWVKTKVTAVNRALSTSRNPQELIPMLHDMDKAFKEKGINPGTSADMTVATVLVACLERLLNNATA